MKDRTTLGQSIVIEYLQRFPDAPNRTLSKKIYKENPLIWPTFNATFCCVRRMRGNQGKKSRRCNAHPEFHRPNGKAGFVT